MEYKMISCRTVSAFAAVTLMALPLAAQAEPGGCVKGAVAGGVAGHFIGSGHGKGGAAAGCAAGMARRHHARKEARENQQQDSAPTQGGSQTQPSAPGGNGNGE